MAHPVCIYITDGASKFQVRDSDLALIRTWQYSGSVYTVRSFTIDNSGNVYFCRGTTYMWKYDENGNLLKQRALYDVRYSYGVTMHPYGYIIQKQKNWDGWNFSVKGWTKDDELEYASNPLYEKLDGIGWGASICCDQDDPDIFFVDGGLYKFSFSTGDTGVSLSSDYNINTLAILGNYIACGLKTTASPRTNKFIIANKSLASYSEVEIDADAVTDGDGTGYIVVDRANFGRLSSTEFILAFRCSAYDSDDNLLHDNLWYIRKYNTGGSQVGSTIALDGSVTYAMPGNYFDIVETSPSVVTNDVSDIVSTPESESVTLNGTLTNGTGKCFMRGFQYYDVESPGTIWDITHRVSFHDNGAYAEEDLSTYITSGHTYKVRAKARNAIELVYGDWVEFTISAEPVVTTQAAQVPDPIANGDYEFADGYGTVVSGSDITERGFEVKVVKPALVYDRIVHHIAGFVDDGDYMIKTEKETGNFVAEAYTLELGKYPAVFSDTLFAGESYTYRAYATNDIGTGYGDWVAFSLGNFPQGTMVDSLLPLAPVVPPSGGDEFPDDEIPITSDDVVPYVPPIYGWPEFPDWDLPDYVDPNELYSLYIIVEPFDGGVTSPPVGVHSGYEKGSVVDVSVEPAEGYKFDTWVGDVIDNGSPVTTVIMDKDKAIGAFLIKIDAEEPIPVPDVPPFEPPDLPGSYGNFYYRKAYAKKDVDELRRKCIAYTKDNTEYCLVLRHNVLVLRQFFNMMSDNIPDRDEFNTFKDVFPTQHLDELYHKKLDLKEFRVIINDFINNAVNNMNTVNHNFNVIYLGLEDYVTGIATGYTDVASCIATMSEDRPEVDEMKEVVDKLRIEAKQNFNTIMKNLNVVKATIT